MLEGLQTEINNHPALIGAAPYIVMAAFNANGSFTGTYTNDQEWRVNEGPVLISISQLMTGYLSQQSGQKLTDFRGSTDSFNNYVNMLLDGVEGAGIDLSLLTMRELFTYLYENYMVCTESEYIALLRLGERELSRAEEVFGRKLTEEDFK